MKFKIEHITTYKYSKNVFLEPHTIRLHPKNNCNQKILNFYMSLDPKEDGKSVCLDAGENNTVIAWFSNTHAKLKIETNFQVETLRSDPFDYIITDDSFSKLPVKYPDDLTGLLNPYIKTNQNEIVTNLAKEILEKSKNDTLGFLINLADHIYRNFPQIIREEGEPWDSDTTIKEKKGSCRDLANLFIDVSRSVGLASRFVSGYAYSPEEHIEDQLHEWVEVYIIGGGWRSYDPSLGLAASDQHISLVSGATHNLVSPVSGNFRGNDVETKLEYKIQISKQ